MSDSRADMRRRTAASIAGQRGILIEEKLEAEEEKT
jgi:hypothetical protein